VSKLSTTTKVLLSLVAALGGIVVPASAQQSRQPRESYSQNTAQPTDKDNLKRVATNLNAQRSELFRRKDLAGIGALYTSDASYIELLPRLQVMRGRAQIQAQLKDVMAANATDVVPTVKTVERIGNGAILAGGDYTLDVKGKNVPGYFFQILRQEEGTWKVAMHAFARLVAVTPTEASEYRAGSQTAMSAQMPHPTDQDTFRRSASNLNAQRSEYYHKRDLAGLTSVYTPDALYIELAPLFSIMKGRAQVQQHMHELMDAKASDISMAVQSAEMTGEDTIMVGGDYSVMVGGGKKVTGHFLQVLRRDGETWNIAMHAFARPEPITATEMSTACDLRCRTGFFGYR
jgi:ketosteroid isomerase-like protein